MPPDYNEYDDYDQGGFRWMSVAVLLLAIAGFFSLAWYAYETGTRQIEQGEIVVIKADPSAVKVPPQEPGGREFAHQDKTIYEVMSDDGQQEDAPIQLLTEPQAPVVDDQPIIEAPQAADKKIAQIIQDAVRETQEEIQTTIREKKPEPEAKPQPEAKPAPQPVVQPDPFAVIDQQKEEATADEAPQDMGATTVQLGAFRSYADATRQWRKIERSHTDVLDDKPHEIVKADLGGKGVFYRLRVGGLGDAKAAKSLCETLSARGQGCFMVK